MPHRLLALVLLVPLVLLVAPTARATPSSSDAEATLKAALTAPGASWSVTTRDGTRTGARGTDRHGTPISTSSAFLWGSVSKPVLGLVAARLASQGRLSLDAPVISLLPTYRPADVRGSSVTVRQLLTHTSGIGALLDELDDATPGRSMDAAVLAIAAQQLIDTPGKNHHYSSANYLLLMAVLQQVTKRPYEQLVVDELAARGGGAVTTRAAADAQLVGGHRYVLGRATRLDDRYDDLGLGYGYLGGSVQQLTALGRSVLADLTGTTASSAATTLATTGVATTSSGSYGLGWRVSTWHGQRVLWHGGAVSGYSTFLGVLPDSGAVVVVLQDAYGPLHDDRLMTAGLAAVTLLAGGTADTASAPLLYLALLVALTLVAVGLAVAVVRRPRRPGGAGVRVMMGLLVAAGAILFPRLAELGSWPSAWLWLPDITVLVAIVGLLALLVLVRGTAGLVTRRRPAAA